MRALDRKLLRDLGRMKGQVVTIAAVVACGIASYISAVSTFHSLREARAAYYETSRFGDVFAQLERAPITVLDRLSQVEGVDRVEVRLVREIRIDLAGFPEPVWGRVISLPDAGPPLLDDLHLRMGRLPDPARPREVVVHEAFAQAHAIEPGGSIRAVLNGRAAELLVVGVALSPETIFAVRPGEITADERRYGILWMRHRSIAPAFDMTGAFNDVVARLQPGARIADVLDSIDRILAPYGGRGAYGRDRHPSDSILRGELQQLEGTARIIPVAFLAVAAFLVNVVLSRLLALQREQIAALKAMGYRDREVGLHYLQFVLVIMLAGCLAGSLLGAWLGSAETALYFRYFRFPALEYRLSPWVVLAGLLVTLASGVGGAFRTLRRVMALPPAEAMRPEVPALYRRTVLERAGLARLIPPVVRMIGRDLERNPLRAGLSSLGIALSVALLVAGRFGQDAVEYVMQLEFEVAQHQDLTVNFLKPVPARAVRALAHLPGVRWAEPLRAVVVRLHAGPRSREVALTGIDDAGVLQRVIDSRGVRVPVPADGVLLSRKLGEILGVGPGDVIEAELLEGDRRTRPLRVSGLVDDFIGLRATMALDALHDFISEGDSVTAALVAIDPRRQDQLLHRLQDIPGVAGASRRTLMLERFRQQNAEVLLVFTLILVAFASVISVGVVYNNARVALSVRSRDLATLRVLGFTRGEISSILLGEQAIQVVLAVPVGMVLGRALAALVALSVDPELFRLPLTIAPGSYAFAALVVTAAAVVSAMAVRRRSDRLDMVGVLKARD